MSTPPRKPDATAPDATLAEPVVDEPSPRSVPDTLIATGEFQPECAPTLLPQAAVAPASAPDTLVAGTGMFVPDLPTQAEAPGLLPTLADPMAGTIPAAPSRSAPPRASTAARDHVGAAATEAFEATGVFDAAGNPVPVSSGLEGTMDLGSVGGATVDLAATGAFTLESTQPGSPSAARGRQALAETDVMATGDYGAAAYVPSIRARNVPPSSRCGRYVLKHFHAKGGMGEIWMAEDPDIGRPVALKRMLSERPDQVYRFRVEAQVTGQLEHPGIVPVHELGVNESGQTFYAMKFVQGRTLKKVVEEYHEQKAAGQASEVEEVRLLQIFLSLCQTVAYAHSRGVLHRDLKPENVMLGEFGETILLDWGIAKVVGESEAMPEGEAGQTTSFVQLEAGDDGTATRVGAIMGTPGYMAPEVAMGQNQEVDFRSDVYLLGATLYEMLTARQPRTGKTAIEMIKKARNEPPARIRTIDAQIPKALDAICFKAMAHLKRDRYQGARELADDVQRYLAGEPVTAYSEGFWERAWRWARRHRVALGRAAVVLAVVGVSVLCYRVIRDLQTEGARMARELASNKASEQARGDLKEFRRLADEASYYAATTNQVAENAPYTDPRKGRETAKAALELAARWGSSLETLPIEEERPATARAIQELKSLAKYLESQETAQPRKVAQRDTADDSTAESRDSQRRILRVSQQKLDVIKGAPPEKKAPDPSRQAVTALDHFFLGEALREQAALHKEVPPARDAWKPDVELMEKAIAEYRKALVVDPEHYWSRYQLGRCYLTLGRLPESVEALGACIATRPESAWAYSTRGLAMFQLKRTGEAIADLDEAVRLNPAMRVSRLNRGVVYLKQKKYQQAKADFEAVLEPPREQRLIQGAYYLGFMHAELGDNVNALKEFNAVVAENSRMRPVYYYRAVVHFANGNDELGFEDLDTYIANGGTLDRDGWMIHGVHGHLLRAIHGELPLAKRRERLGVSLANLAVGELLQAIEHGGRAWDIFDDLGAMLEHTGRLKDAIPAYSKGLQFEPNNVKLRNKRGWAWENAGRHQEALSDFIAAAKADPENAEAHTGVGYIRALAKQNTEAQREAELALLHGSDEFLVLHNIACIYATLSETAAQRPEAYQDVAISVLKRAIAKWKKADTPLNELDMIKGETAFKSLHGRPDFQELTVPEAEKPEPGGH